MCEGKQIREPGGPTKKVAEQALAARKADIARERFDLHDIKPSPLFEDFAKKYLEYAKDNKRSWNRDEYALRRLVPFFGDQRLNQIRPFLIEAYKSQRKAEVKPVTVNRELALLKYMFNLAIKWGKTSSNPMNDVKPFKIGEKPERVLSDEESERLIEASPDFLEPIVIMALHTGMRKGEILGLRWSMLNFGNGAITVEKSKSGKCRSIPMHDRVRETLMRLEKNGEYVFTKNGGEPMKNIRNPFEAAQKRARICPRCTFHDLRHTFATRLVENGCDLVSVMQFLGHSQIATTMRYSHPSPEHMREAIASLNYHGSITEGSEGSSAVLVSSCQTAR